MRKKFLSAPKVSEAKNYKQDRSFFQVVVVGSLDFLSSWTVVLFGPIVPTLIIMLVDQCMIQFLTWFLSKPVEAINQEFFL